VLGELELLLSSLNKQECVAERSKALPSDGSLVKRREFKSHRTHFCTGNGQLCDETLVFCVRLRLGVLL
jgi:hypothetical protein